MSAGEDKTKRVLTGMRRVEGTLSGRPAASGAASDAHSGPIVVLVLTYRGTPRIVALTGGGASVVIGRDAIADTVIDDARLSRTHARFSFERGSVTVEDLGSKNGTFVNGHRIETKTPIGPRDRVELGDVLATLTIVAPEGGARPSLDTHDSFRANLDLELARAKTEATTLALVMLRIADERSAFALWSKLGSILRTEDRLALYGSSVLEISIPRVTPMRVDELARRLVSAGEPELEVTCAITLYPDGAATAEALIESSRRALLETSATKKIVIRGASVVDVPLGTSPALLLGNEMASMAPILKVLDRVARSTLPVLILGESGTGKELIAHEVHRKSDRARQKLRIVNCAAIPDSLVESVLFGHEKGAFTGAVARAAGVFEAAHEGTVFLDEIGELPAHAQAALLRVLEAKVVNRVGSNEDVAVDVRIIAATHRDLDRACADGEFRLDLLHRLNTFVLKVPPLRARRDEIPALIEELIAQANRTQNRRVTGLDSGALAFLMRHEWPGNVRELRNVIERAVVIAEGDVITAEDLPESVLGGSPDVPANDDEPGGTSLDFKTRVQDYEREMIASALEGAAWNQREAARRLRIPLRTLVHKIKVYSLARPR